MSRSLAELRIAVLVAPGVAEPQVSTAAEALESAGAKVELVSHRHRSVLAEDANGIRSQFRVDRPLDAADPRDYHAVILLSEDTPGVIRNDARAVAFLRALIDDGKVVAALGRGSEALLETSMLRNRQMTSAPELEADLRKAGARWTDQPVAVDGPLVTARDERSLQAFCDALVHVLEERVAAGSIAWDRAGLRR